jgi:hypothetical protein
LGNLDDRLIKKICSKTYVSMLKKLIVSGVISWSRDINISHIQAIRCMT